MLPTAYAGARVQPAEQLGTRPLLGSPESQVSLFHEAVGTRDETLAEPSKGMCASWKRSHSETPAVAIAWSLVPQLSTLYLTWEFNTKPCYHSEAF